MLMMLAMAGVRDRTPAADAHDVCYGRVVGHNHGQLMLMMLAMRGYGTGTEPWAANVHAASFGGQWTEPWAADAHDAGRGRGTERNHGQHGRLMLMMLAVAGVWDRTMCS